MMRSLWIVLVLSVSLLLAWPASAQTVLNPTKATFTASTDHDLLIDGTPFVTGYELRIRVSPSGELAATIPIGKPMPVAGQITIPVDFAVLPLSTTVRYTAVVVALGPTGEGVSQPSNAFLRAGAPAAPTSVTVIK